MSKLIIFAKIIVNLSVLPPPSPFSKGSLHQSQNVGVSKTVCSELSKPASEPRWKLEYLSDDCSSPRH